MALIFCSLMECASGQTITSTSEVDVDESEISQVVEQTSSPQELFIEDKQYNSLKLDINEMNDEDLRRIGLISEEQVLNFIAYRNTCGLLIDVHELQALPGWDVNLVRTLVNCCITKEVVVRNQELKRLRPHGLLFLRIAAPLISTANGRFRNLNADSMYAGGMNYLSLLVRTDLNKRLRVGVNAEKDPGEAILSHRNSLPDKIGGFLQYSDADTKVILGDYVINYAQGLTMGMSADFRGIGDVILRKRELPTLKGYAGFSEFRFFRGLAISREYKNLTYNGFISARKLDAIMNTDTLNGVEGIRYFNFSGLHRTEREINNRNNVLLLSKGFQLSGQKKSFMFGLSIVHHRFSLPYLGSGASSKLFTPHGRKLFNLGADFSYSHQNLHFFGEYAYSANGGRAMMFGVLGALGKQVDISLSHRNYSADYQSFFSCGFQSTLPPMDESGIYAAIKVQPHSKWMISASVNSGMQKWIDYSLYKPLGRVHFNFHLEHSFNKKNKFRISITGNQREIIFSNTSAVTRFYGHRLTRQLIFGYSGIPGRQTTIQVLMATRYSMASGSATHKGTLLKTVFSIKGKKTGIALAGSLVLYRSMDYFSSFFLLEPDGRGISGLQFFSGTGSWVRVSLTKKFRKKIEINIQTTDKQLLKNYLYSNYDNENQWSGSVGIKFSF